MDISLKVRLLGKKLCLVYQRLMASRLDDPSLMEGQRAEAAATKAALLLIRLNLISRIAGTTPGQPQ